MAGLLELVRQPYRRRKAASLPIGRCGDKRDRSFQRADRVVLPKQFDRLLGDGVWSGDQTSDRSSYAMMTQHTKREWVAGAWFGSQFGGTLWIFLAAVTAALREPLTGAAVFAVWAVPNVAGIILWCRRANRSFHAAIQILLVIMALSGLITVAILDARHLWEAIQVGSNVSAETGYAIVLVVFLTLMAFLYLRVGRESGASAGS
jgi:hypothetical protein